MKQGHESVLLPSLHARRNVFIALTALVFVSAMTYLLWQIHAVDGQRRALAMDQFREDTVRMAGDLEFFFFERHNDIETLSESRPIEVYFENVALGMSARYGLLASSQEVATHFGKTLQDRRIGGRQVFEAFVLLDQSGTVVAQADASSPGDGQGGYIPEPGRWPDRRQVHEDGFQWTIVDSKGVGYPVVIMSHPVTHDNEQIGLVLARLSFPVLLDVLFKGETDGAQRAFLLGYGSRHLFSRLGEERDLVRPLEGIGSAVQLLDAESGTLGGLFETDGPFLSVAAGVAGSGLHVYGVAPEDVLIGSSTWSLSILVAALSLTLLSGFVFFTRSNTQRLLLAARFEEQESAATLLRKRMDEFNTLFDALPGYAWYKGADGHVLAANAATCALVGLPFEEVAGKTVHDFFPGDVADEMARLDAMLTSEQRRSLDIEQVFERNGEPLIIANRMVSIVHQDGTVGGIIGLGIDITDKKRVEAELVRSTSLQKVIMDLAIGFVNTPLQELDQAIMKALALIGEYARVDRVYLFAYDFAAGTMSNTHEWCAPGVSPELDNLQDVPNELFPEWVAAHRRKEPVHIPRVEDLSMDDQLRLILEPQGTRTLITLPLVHGAQCFGYVGFDAVRELKVWTEAEINLLKVTAELLTNAQLRRLHEAHLLEAKGAAEAAYAEVEARIRERTRQLAEANDQLKGEIAERQRAIRNLNHVLGSISAVLIVVDNEGLVFRWSPVAEKAFGLQASAVEGRDFRRLAIPWDGDIVQTHIDRCRRTGAISKASNVRFDRADGAEAFLMLTVSPIVDESQVQTGFLLLGEDITELRILEARLAQAAKLEAIGQLAAGIAHEISTPAQYVGDSVTFLKDFFADLEPVLNGLDDACRARTADGFSGVCSGLDRLDLEFVTPEIPRTFDRIFDGMQRINTIVQAMNRFSHSHGSEKKLMDINEIIRNTLAITRNEWKYVADVETDLGPGLDEVNGLADEMGQVFLNIIINAAHAISEVIRGTADKGTIVIATRRAGDCVEIRIRDTGAGIPKSIRDRVFNLFFTTKGPGRGTGQGLAIAHDIVVNKHGGLITFVSESGHGTTFIIQIPLGGDSTCEMGGAPAS